MGRQGVVVFTRRLQYLNRSVTLPDGTRHTIRLGEEKGVDSLGRARTEPLDQARLCVPLERGQPIPPRGGRNRLDRDRPHSVALIWSGSSGSVADAAPPVLPDGNNGPKPA